MSLRVMVDHSPAYELVASIAAFAESVQSKASYRTLDLGADWPRSLRQALPPGVHLEIAAMAKSKPPVLLLDLLVWLCPDKQSICGFLKWLAALGTGEMYELLAPYLWRESRATLANLGELKERYHTLLRSWHEHYLSKAENSLWKALRHDARSSERLAAQTDPVQLVDIVTGGIWLGDDPELDMVVLAPQFHFRPRNIYQNYGNLAIILYPSDIPSRDDSPPQELMRVARALSDEGRLRLLRFLGSGAKSHSELVRFTGLTKGTVSYHMSLLRAAGLVRTHVGKPRDHDRYSLRRVSIVGLGKQFDDYVAGKDGGRG